MTEILLIILILGLLIVLCVVAYNIYLENQYRKKIYKQFGNSDKDVLVESSSMQVRDADGTGMIAFKIKENFNKAFNKKKTVVVDEKKASEDKMEALVTPQEFTKVEEEILIKEDENNNSFEFETIAVPTNSQESSNTKYKLLLNLKELSQIDLPWFNKNFDYMAYVSLVAPKELLSVPRLSSKRRFQIIACTMDDQFQVAEPIPSVAYKGFIIGLQSISRQGLATRQELENFGEKVNEFAKQLGGNILLTDIDSFLKVASALDDLCARVDQIIALHLTSRTFITGTELRKTLEEDFNFVLSSDGAFYYPNEEEGIFKIISLVESPFTPQLLATENYKGFSILFDITRVPVGAKNFDRFMGLAVKLSSNLDLELVDDKLELLSMDWLRNIKTYVLERQDEMKSAGIVPGEDLANRLFV